MAVGRLLETYLSRFGISTEGLSVETIGFAAALDVVARLEPGVAEAVVQELGDQRSHLKLIASENFASPAVLLAMGNWLSDKYAEGAPGHRLYAGCDNVDTVESRTNELACALFGADHAYSQPHSGIDANLVAFWAVLSQRVESPALQRLAARHVNDLSDEDWEMVRQQLGNQTLLGMSLQAGGHLTHGFRPNISGKLFRHRSYSVDPDTFLLDYDVVRQRAHEERPLILIAGYSSYPRLVNFRVLREIADEVGATFMVDMAHFAGLVAGKVLTGDYDPVPHAHIVTTTTHKTLRGPRGGMVLCQGDLAEFVDRGCPLVLGGPLPHVMAAKAVALSEAAQPSFRRYAETVVDNAAGARTGSGCWWHSCGDRRNRQPPRTRRCPQVRAQRAPSRGGVASRGHYLEPQRRTRRDERVLVHERPATGHTRRHYARHGCQRDGRNCRGCRRCSPCQLRRRRDIRTKQGQTLARAVPPRGAHRPLRTLEGC